MNTLSDEKEHEKHQQQTLRGWILYLVYGSNPRPLELSALKDMLDRRNFPMSSARLARELSFLCNKDLIEIAPVGKKRNTEDQDTIILRYMEARNVDHLYCLRLCPDGADFQEDETISIKGIKRIG